VAASVQTIVPVAYVADLDRSREFYGLFDFVEQTAGADSESRWSYLRCGEHYILLASVPPPLRNLELPLLFYFYVEQVATLTERLTAAGVQVQHVGYPDHAPGGEARFTDPDGNTILIGQRAPRGGGDQHDTDSTGRFSLLKEAAARLHRRGDAPARCQIGEVDGQPCPRAAEVKLADAWGDTAWACLKHADETLVSARGAFLATQDDQGLGPFLEVRSPKS
jgi:catechol 2,3-dioxygenase-like lactoylglutathione lyase family enzyme